jgi:uncharacterized damage-inducible protein DinB
MKEFIVNFANFNEWANRKIAIWLLSVDKNLLDQKVESSFPSIFATVQHILSAQTFWTAFVSNDLDEHFIWSKNMEDIHVVINELTTQSSAMSKKIASFSEYQFMEKLDLNMPWCKNKLARYEYIIHCINHSTYHRGQMITMARNVGIKDNIPNTDYNFFHTV